MSNLHWRPKDRRIKHFMWAVRPPTMGTGNLLWKLRRRTICYSAQKCQLKGVNFAFLSNYPPLTPVFSNAVNYNKIEEKQFMLLFKRENYLSKIRNFYHVNDLIKVITGVRRSGKSSIMRLIADELQEKGVKESNICFLNLDAKGMRNIKTADQLERLIDSKANVKGTKYLFLDEIQNVKGYEEVVNAYREEGDYSIFLTGSNSYLLSGELMTKLTGRYIEFEVYPLNFEEYLQMKGFYHMPIGLDLATELRNYLQEGGFPETVLLPSLGAKRTYVKALTDEILKKDIYRRIKIRKCDSFDVVMRYMINNFSRPTSKRNILKGLEEGGLKIKESTLMRYIQALEDAKIIYPCQNFDLKSKRSLRGEKKYYLSDLSFTFLTDPNNISAYGPCLENIVYIYARSKGYEAYVGKIGKLECDFVLRDLNLDYSYVQVAYTIASDTNTMEREYRSLLSIKDNYPKYLLTTDFLLQKKDGIKNENLMEFMRDGKLF